MFTRDEKDAVARYLATDQNTKTFWWDTLPYVAPPTLFAAYALWEKSLSAMTVAFITLLFIALWYLSYQARAAGHILSATRKYEEAVSALEKPTV